MSNQGFCARCFNYVDACDCLNYEYDLEFENDKVIPPPPPEEQPEVGTVWYFVSPISPLSYGLEVVKADKLGLGILLNQENLWTLNPPPGDPALYLSIPVDRLPMVSISSGVGLGSQYKQLQPWELNYFNFNLSLFDKVKTLAQDLAQCKQKWKPLATACKIVKGISNFFKEWNSDEIPIPEGLLDELSRIDNYVDPAILIGIILSYFPPEIVEELNNSVLTAIDYDWVHRHLVDTLDPDIGYEDKKQEYGNAFPQGDIFNTDGSYPFPKPSESIAQGGGTTGQQQASQRQGPDRQMSRMPPRKASTGGVMGMVCNKDNSKCWPRKNKGSLWGDNVVAMTQEQIDREMTSRSIVRPVFDDIIPYDSEDDDNFPRKIVVNPPDTDVEIWTGTTNFGAIGNATTQYPVMFQVLNNVGANATQFFNYPMCEAERVGPFDVKVSLHTQWSPGATQFTFIGVASLSTGGNFTRNYQVTKVSGPDDTLVVTQDGVTTNYIAVGGVITLPINFVNGFGGFRFLYKHVLIKGLLSGVGTNTIWNISQPTDRTGTFGTGSNIHTMNTVVLTPRPGLPFTSTGFLTADQLINNVIYEAKEITCQPWRQIPIMLLVRNEINMVSYAPNSAVTPGTFGYVVGRSGNTGLTLGSPYLPFDPVGRSTAVTYKVGIEKSQGQSFIIGLLSYSL